MNWSEISNIFGCFSENLLRAGDRIEAAKRSHQQIYHANHRPWYVKRMRIVQNKYVLLKRRLSGLESVVKILRGFEIPFKALIPPEIDIGEKGKAMDRARRLCESLHEEIQRRQEEEFDILPRDRVVTDDRLCFVMMPFRPSKEFNPVYAAIRKAVRKHGLKCVRSDNIFDTKAVILDIWESIRKSRICIADISNKNPNVFYELGMAHSLPRRVMLISKPLEKDEKPAFDTNHVRCTYYRNTPSGLKVLQRSIARTLRTVLR